MKFIEFAMPLAALLMVCGCGKKDGPVASDPGGLIPEAVAAKPMVAEHLGFATRVPADCDFHFSAFYDGEEMFDSMMGLLL